jgi:hypothetical protein
MESATVLLALLTAARRVAPPFGTVKGKVNASALDRAFGTVPGTRQPRASQQMGRENGTKNGRAIDACEQ